MTLPSNNDVKGQVNNLYLFVKVFLQELRNDQDEEAAKSNGGEASAEDPDVDPGADAGPDSNDPEPNEKGSDSSAVSDADSSDSN